MKYEKPITVEIALPDLLATVKDKDKCRCIKAMVESIMEVGIIGEIRDLVNNTSYDD